MVMYWRFVVKSMSNQIEEAIYNLSKYKDIIKNVNRIDKMIRESNIDFFELFDDILKKNKEESFLLMTFLVKKRKLYEFNYFNFYEKWLFNYVDSWGKCDAYCYRVLNPMIELYPELYNNILNWSKSNKIYVRRASLVCFIISKADFSVDYDLNKLLYICDSLKYDKHIHIQKGLGWLLKYAYLTYPSEIENYLRNNVNVLSRTTFRYALEKMNLSLRNELMKL